MIKYYNNKFFTRTLSGILSLVILYAYFFQGFHLIIHDHHLSCETCHHPDNQADITLDSAERFEGHCNLFDIEFIPVTDISSESFEPILNPPSFYHSFITSNANFSIKQFIFLRAPPEPYSI